MEASEHLARVGEGGFGRGREGGRGKWGGGRQMKSAKTRGFHTQLDEGPETL